MAGACKVRPMVIAEGSACPMPIDLAVAEALDADPARSGVINASPGSGKSTAIAALREVLPSDADRILDDHTAQQQLGHIHDGAQRGRPIICTSPVRIPSALGRRCTNLALVSWEDDQVIEYVL